MNNRLFDQIRDSVTYLSNNFQEGKTTCLEYGGIDDELIRFSIGNMEVSINVDSECHYSVNSRDYLDSMISEEDMDEYRNGNYLCWYMNSFFIEVNEWVFHFHDMNKDMEEFLDFLNIITNKNN